MDKPTKDSRSVATLLVIIDRKTTSVDMALDQRDALQGIITDCHAFLGLVPGVGLRQGLDDLWESRARLRKLVPFTKHVHQCKTFLRPPGSCNCGLAEAKAAVAEHGDLEE